MFYDYRDLEDLLTADDIETNVDFEGIVDKYNEWYDENIEEDEDGYKPDKTDSDVIEEFIDEYHITDKQVGNIVYSIVSNIADNMTEYDKLETYENLVYESIADLIYNYLDDNQQIDELRYEIESKLNDMIAERFN